MPPNLYWVDGMSKGRVAIAPRPRGGDWLEQDIRTYRQAGVDIVVSLLTDEEVTEFDLTQEAEFCSIHGLEFHSFPIPDRSVPQSLSELALLVRELCQRLESGKAVFVHCRAGIGRSALVAACTLIRAGMTPAAALETIGKARGFAVPETGEQKEWVENFAKSKEAAV